MRLQNIRFPEADICREEELYFHRNGEWVDFNGYFNLFYIEKRKKYTNQESLTLHLELNGCQAIRLMLDENIIQEKMLTGGKETLDLEFPYPETEKGVFWFSVKPEKNSEAENRFEKSAAKPEENSICDISAYVKGWYEGTCQNEKPVRIAAVVCTFKREPYVLRNLKSVLRFLEQPENASLNLCYWLVDNGRTLSEHEEISHLAARYPDTIRIIPNRNVGGAGGFTRGMIEAIEEKERLGLTHVQMMDDDAVMDPELFVRAYGFLGMRKDEWEDIRLGGTLLREDYPYICQAMGEWFENFNVTNQLVMTDMRSFDNCRNPLVERPHDEYKMYSGWWCCCYSLNTVRNDNLPLPLFIHRDDIEYEIRNKETGIVFLNGLNVWHKGFEVNFLGTNAYYDVRNNLIFAALHEPDMSRIRMWRWISKFIITAVLKMRYEEAYFSWQGVRDFMKGSEWLIRTDAEQLNNQLRKHLPEMIPMDVEEQPTIKELQRCYSLERNKGRFWKKVTFNGWFLIADKEIGILRPYDAPFSIFRKKKIELWDTGAKKKREAARDGRQLIRAIGYCLHIMQMLFFQYGKIQKEYEEKYEILKNKSVWEKEDRG
jgi:galactofuranosylgalactofuranosylrhamnosyl-N-acetylglucosaminyl-diphospho-decaprenol beta-1,5/1,6-galactofuranosyltransferase